MQASSDRKITEHDQSQFAALASRSLRSACTFAAACQTGKSADELKKELSTWWSAEGAALVCAAGGDDEDVAEDEVTSAHLGSFGITWIHLDMFGSFGCTRVLASDFQLDSFGLGWLLKLFSEIFCFSFFYLVRMTRTTGRMMTHQIPSLKWAWLRNLWKRMSA